MAEIDAVISSLLWKTLMFSITVFILYNVFKPSWRRLLKNSADKVGAFVMFVMVDLICSRSAKVNAFKKPAFAMLEDRPLKIAEIGIGTGPNFEFYPAGSKVYAIEPNPQFRYFVRRNQRRCSKQIDVEFLEEFGENMVSIGDSTMDIVVLFEVLCSVKDVVEVLKETKRILKRDGTVIVVQHCPAEPNTWTHLMQRLSNPAHKAIAGCDLLRNYRAAFKQVGFSDIHLKKVDASFFYLRFFMPTIVPHLMGTCRK